MLNTNYKFLSFVLINEPISHKFLLILLMVLLFFCLFIQLFILHYNKLVHVNFLFNESSLKCTRIIKLFIVRIYLSFSLYMFVYIVCGFMGTRIYMCENNIKGTANLLIYRLME